MDLSGQQLAAASERKLIFSETYYIYIYIYINSYGLSIYLLNTLVRGLGFPDKYSVSLQCVAQFLYKTQYKAHTQQQYKKSSTKLARGVTMEMTRSLFHRWGRVFVFFTLIVLSTVVLNSALSEKKWNWLRIKSPPPKPYIQRE